ncbi:MAG: hypothetical protein CO072_02070 [Candidatus Huberarchaeum crystalense]|uniref:S5 DRBM domain-containing protein n=1 Tax=Huberarchaeum crystalense TaxID=2014257 RepID=A0A2H9RCL9_HUBC1|nr:MAG: hypothetical protein CO072_02070 [Candidatus Huberarchaeum crystalense]
MVDLDNKNNRGTKEKESGVEAEKLSDSKISTISLPKNQENQTPDSVFVKKAAENIAEPEKQDNIAEPEKQKSKWGLKRNARNFSSNRREPEQSAPIVVKTRLGKQAIEGKITEEQLLEKRKQILETAIVDKVFPELEHQYIELGYIIGKGGAGVRGIFLNTQRKHKSGNRTSSKTLCVVGNKKGVIGYGYASGGADKMRAKDKSLTVAKKSIFKFNRGSGSWETSDAKEEHSLPFKVEGKVGAVRVILIPAPKGTGIVASKELKKVIQLAGIEDVYCNVRGSLKNRLGATKALIKALDKTTRMRG